MASMSRTARLTWLSLGIDMHERLCPVGTGIGLWIEICVP